MYAICLSLGGNNTYDWTYQRHHINLSCLYHIFQASNNFKINSNNLVFEMFVVAGKCKIIHDAELAFDCRRLHESYQ